MSYSNIKDTTLEYLTSRQLSPDFKRKVSQYEHERTRSNFVLMHQAQQYTVVRVYIPSIRHSQVKLYYSKFTPKSKIGTICIVPGFGESTDQYLQTASFFAKKGYVVNMLDLRGFGYSGGLRVNNSVKHLLSDIELILTRCCENRLPTYLLAHGFGNLLVFALLQENPGLPLAGVISLSPSFSLLKFQNEQSTLTRFLISTLGIVFDDILINNNINPTFLTDNPNKLQECFDGVFNYQYMTLGMTQQYSALAEKVLKDASKFRYPLYMIIGGRNLIQGKEQIKKFYNSLSSKEKSSFVYAKGYHQLHKDQFAERQIFARVLDWVEDFSSNKNQVKWKNLKKTDIIHCDILPKNVLFKKMILVGVLLTFLVVSFRKRKMV